MTEQRANTWLEAWRQAVLDHLPRNRREALWLWILAAQAEADPLVAGAPSAEVEIGAG